MVGLSVLQNLQQAQANAKLQALINGKQIEAEEKKAHAAMRDTLYQLSEVIRSGSQDAQRLPAAFYASLVFEAWCAAQEINSASFESFQDKDFFRAVQTQAKEIQARARQELPDCQTIELLVAAPAKLAILAAGKAWMDAKAAMTGGKLLWNGWPGVHHGIIACFVIAPALAFAFGAMNGRPGLDPAYPPLLVIGAVGAIAAMSWRRRKAAELNAIVSPHGGLITSRARLIELDEIIAGYEKEAVHPWITPNKDWGVVLRAFEERVRKECARLAIPTEYVLG